MAVHPEKTYIDRAKEYWNDAELQRKYSIEQFLAHGRLAPEKVHVTEKTYEIDPKLNESVKTPVMWKSGRHGAIIAAEAKTIISGHTYFIHATEWWNGEGMELTIEGPKDDPVRIHISLPSEVWAVIASVSRDIIGEPIEWIKDTKDEA